MRIIPSALSLFKRAWPFTTGPDYKLHHSERLYVLSLVESLLGAYDKVPPVLERQYAKAVVALLESLRIRDINVGLNTCRVCLTASEVAAELCVSLSISKQTCMATQLGTAISKLGCVSGKEGIEEIETTIDLISSLEFIQPVYPLIMEQYERFDGSGYPKGLRRENICIMARIATVAYAFADLRMAGRHGVLDLIREQSGIGFDPHVVQALVDLKVRDLSASNDAD